MLGTGSLLIDVQGEDDTLTLEYMRKPAVVQRVLNSQINEIVGGGRREAIPASMQPRDRHGAPYADRDTDEHRGYGDGGYDDDDDVDAHDTPPFGVGGSAPPQTPPRSVPDPAPAATGRRRAPPASRYGTGSLSSTTCASAASSPRRSSPPRRASSSTASDRAGPRRRLTAGEAAPARGLPWSR